MENLELSGSKYMFSDIYHNRRVLITGHTGFKGSWLAFWLTRLGADITGYSLHPPTEPNHFDLFSLDIDSIIEDIRNEEKTKQIFKEKQPEIVFHLAAQPIVRSSYKYPIETFSTNAMGTINIFEASRASGSVRAIVNITSDKCYQNQQWLWGYREIDPVGGNDPYSASKGCAELITSCWRNSFFNPTNYGKTHQTLVASCRSGNVIGGGDWACDRLLPDLIRSTQGRQNIQIRSPMSIRPWQHVLDPLSGYLLLGQRLLERRKDFAEAWNFGPFEHENITVSELANQAKQIWPEITYDIKGSTDQPHEETVLKLNCTKSRALLGWFPVWNQQTAIDKSISWYKYFYEYNKVRSLEDLKNYISDARLQNAQWCVN